MELSRVGYESADAVRPGMLFCLDLTSNHQADAGGNVEGSPKTNESYTKTRQKAGTHTHFHNIINRCELAMAHRVHARHDELMHGDLCSCLMLKLQICVL